MMRNGRTISIGSSCVVVVAVLLLVLPSFGTSFQVQVVSSSVVHPDGTILLSKQQQQRRKFLESLTSSSSSTTAIFSSSNPNGKDKEPLILRSTNGNNELSSAKEQQQQPQQQQQDEQSRQKQLDWDTISRQFGLFKDMAYPYYQESKAGRWLLAGLLGLTLCNSGVSVLFSYLGKDFWNALSAKDTAVFYQVLAKYLGALVLGAPVVTLYKYQREQLAVHWREWMTARTFSLYTNNRVYYTLDTDAVDNPDQRITEDVKTFTAFSLQLVTTALTSLIDLVAFSTILWSIYPQLFGAILIYATAGTVLTAWLGKSLVHLNFKQLQREADLRYSLVRLRDNAESIAFYAGEDLEGQAVEQRLENATNNRRAINAAQRNLEFFTTSYRYLVQIVPVAVVAPRYFAGDIALGVISQSVGAFNHILSDLSIIVNQFESLSSFSAGIERLATFYEAMRTVDPARRHEPLLRLVNGTSMMTPPLEANGKKNETTTIVGEDSISHISESVDDMKIKDDLDLIDLHTWSMSENPKNNGMILSIDNLELCTPDRKRVLIRDLSLRLQEGQNLLIVGASGAGKSSLLRAIAGLWTAGKGTIERPCNDDVYFLPQRPYCTLGSLKDQLLYPSLDYTNDTLSDDESSQNKIVPRSHWLKETLTDQDLVDILEQVNLLYVAQAAGDGDAVKGLYSVFDWSNRLSLGEQQRLAFARLIVNRPSLVILDEATSALDITAETRMYSLLQNMARKNLNGKNGLSAPGLTYISVGHRPSLLAFHDKKLWLGGGKEHEFTDIEKASIQIPTQVPNTM